MAHPTGYAMAILLWLLAAVDDAKSLRQSDGRHTRRPVEAYGWNHGANLELRMMVIMIDDYILTINYY